MKEKVKKAFKENLVGKIIYGFLLFAPLMSILVTSLYVVLNKNAYQSYGDNQSIQTSLNYNSVVGNEYIINWIDNTTGQTNNTTAIIAYQTITIDGTPSGSSKFRYGNSKRITFFDDSNTQLGYLDNIATFTYIANDSNAVAQQPWFNRQLVIKTTGKLDNAWEYGIQKVENNNLYNWSKTTGTYSVLQLSCETLGITNTFTPMLLAYWIMISVMYIIYDIALVGLHMVHRKIHEFEESI